MVNGPPCAACGFTLRWLPQQNSWGCDRCQRMFPAQGPGAPQQQAAPPPPQQGSPWAPPQQQGFAPPQQQGFGQRPPGPAAPPNPYAPQQPQQPVNPYAATAAPYGAQPPKPATPYPPQGAPPSPYGAPPPQANPYAPQQGAPPNPYQPQPGAPPPGYQQPPYGAQPATPAPSMAGGGVAKKSNKGLVIGLAVAAVAVAGGVVAFVMLRGGGGAHGGGSRDEVVKGTLAAIAAGSVDDLLKMSDPQGLYDKMVDCEGKTPRVKSEMDREGEDDKELSEKDKEERDPKKMIEKQKKEFADLVKYTKGAKIELVEIEGKEPPAPSDDESKNTDDDTPKNRGMVFKKGQRLMKGCVAKTPVRVAEVKLKVKVTAPKEEASEQDVEMGMIQIGKGWWLIQPPMISAGAAGLIAEVTAMKDQACACKDAACAKKLKDEFRDSPRRRTLKKQVKALPDEDRDKIKKIEGEMEACEKKLGGGEAIAALTSFKDKMCACQDKACAEKVTQEMTVWGKSHMDDVDKPDSEQMKQITEISEELSKCMMKAMEDKSGGGIGATIGEVGGVTGGGSSGLGPTCTEYKGMIKRLAECPKMPQQSRDSMNQALKTMEDAWKNYDSMPESAKKATEDACRQGADALKSSLAQLGC